MKRIILLSFNSTDNDDCGLPYLCSNSGCNETQLIYQQSSYTSLSRVKAILRLWSSSQDGRKYGGVNVLFKKITRGEMDLILSAQQKQKHKLGQSVSVQQSRSFTG